MQKFMKTIISAVQMWVKEKIKESAADWNQNDPSADNYVKNRPFYEEDGVIHKLDSKYLDLPDNIATTDDVQSAVDLASEAQLTANSAIANAEAALTTADGKMNNINPTGTGSFSMGRKSGTVIGGHSHAEGYNTTASGESSHAEGSLTTASGESSHAEGHSTIASGFRSHAEGYQTTASGKYSHAEGYNTTASGESSHAGGRQTIAQGRSQYVSGEFNVAERSYFRIETVLERPEKICTYSQKNSLYRADSYTYDDLTGLYTLTEPVESGNLLGSYYFIFGGKSRNVMYYNPYGDTVYSTGTNSISEIRANAGGIKYTSHETAKKGGKYIHIVGNGTSDAERSNAHTLDWEGNAWYQGDIYVGSISGTNKDKGSKKLATEEYVNTQISTIPVPDVSGQIDSHNISLSAHNDIRLLVDEITNRLNTLADSDDTTLDQMSELVEYIKSNKTLIEEITTKKVNISDIINNLTTNVDNKPLSAAQGVVLKELIDAIKVPTKVSELTNDSGYLTEHQSLEGLATEEYVNNLISSSGSGIQTITTPENSGLKVTRTDNNVSIEFDDEIVFIFDGGNAFD